MGDAEFPLGTLVRLQLRGGEGGSSGSGGEEVQGQVFNHDPQQGLLTLLAEGAHRGVQTVRILNTAHVAAVLSRAQPAAPYDTFLPEIDIDACYARERKALAQAERDAARVGAGVTKEAQALMEALSKTLPCTWRGKSIVVLDEVQVQEPYTAEACIAISAHKGTLQRVQLILNTERKRLGLDVE